MMVRTGLDNLLSKYKSELEGRKVGLVTHAAAVDSRWTSSIDAINTIPGVKLVSIFGPEHGLHGQAQDLIGVKDDEAQGIQTQVISLYGKTFESLKPTFEQLKDIELLIIDMQDVGSRYYTFQATMKYCMQVALPMGLDVMVLDRPNPIGGKQIEGPIVSSGYESFVGVDRLPIRHAMTMGELAGLYYRQIRNFAEDKQIGSLRVIPCEGWHREMYFDSCNIPWVIPSPNMPTLDTALVYPGQCLFEGTNLSEGRGTTRPFEICGAPWIDSIRLAKTMNSKGLPGVVFRPVWFRPTFQKHAGIDCGGVQIHVIDRQEFLPVRTSLALLIQMRNESLERFDWRRETYEFVSDPIAIDLLFGSSRERVAIEQGATWEEISEPWAQDELLFHKWVAEHRLY